MLVYVQHQLYHLFMLVIQHNQNNIHYSNHFFPIHVLLIHLPFAKDFFTLTCRLLAWSVSDQRPVHLFLNFLFLLLSHDHEGFSVKLHVQFFIFKLHFSFSFLIWVLDIIQCSWIILMILIHVEWINHLNLIFLLNIKWHVKKKT